AAIDVGSGTGFMTSLLLSEFLCPVHAVDVAPGMIEWLNSYIQTPRLRTHLLDGQALHPDMLPLPRPAILVSSMCVQWFDQLENALQEWQKMADIVCLSVLLDGSFEAWHGAHLQTGQKAGLRPLPKEAELIAMLNRFTEQGLTSNYCFKTLDFLDYQLDGLSFARSLRAIGADTPKAHHRPVNLRAVINELGVGCTMNYKVGFIYLSRL
ncbi:MAG: class I SAM-dependent methyltransferase, partial [Limnobacter sp.]|nr:class I SAM-dependent methyltransferase [Limnobacter sp.]